VEQTDDSQAPRWPNSHLTADAVTPLSATRPPQDQEEGVEDLLDTLRQCVERIDRYRRLGQRVGESNTRPG
jgi:hypothetical protein